MGSASIAVLALSGGLLAAQPAAAQQWTGAFSPSWSASGNWSTFAVPAVNSNPEIDAKLNDPAIGAGEAAVANIVTVGTTGNGYLYVKNGGTLDTYLGYLGKAQGSFGYVDVRGAGSRWTAGQSVYVGDAGGGSLTISNGGKVQDISGYLGYAKGSAGQAIVEGTNSLWLGTGDLNVGYEGTGDLTIRQGGSVGSGTTILGRLADSVGKVEMYDTGSSLMNAGDLVIGDAGQGTLYIASGLAQNQQGVIGRAAGSTGKVTLGTSDAVWINSANLTIGDGGSGVLEVRSGAVVSNTFASVGYNATSTGAVTVDGAGSTWTNSSDILVGNGGTGTLTVSNGGGVTSASGVISEQVGSTGAVTVVGIGSTWSNSTTLFVGRNGTGTLNIQNGGKVSNSSGSIASNAGTIGNVTVTGAGSTWINSNNLGVGDVGVGTLNILNGGTVSSVLSALGGFAGGTGTVTIDGAGSTWTNSSDILVGNGGTGTLAVSNGGGVTSASAVISEQVGSTGAVTVDGIGSTWSNSTTLFVGRNGTGTLNIQNGGKVSNSSGSIASNAGTIGNVTVTGAGSTWINSNNLGVGDVGVGTLNILNGGTVSSVLSALGGFAGGTGTVTIDGAGSTWTNSSDILVGNGGTGVLTVSNGGSISNVHANVGSGAGSTGAVIVDGAGSIWNNTAGLNIGASGGGTLKVLNGGKVIDTTSKIGFNAGSTGAVTVADAGSKWVNIGDILVGQSGAGALTVSGGGFVSAVNTSIGDGVDGVGVATLTGPGSIWTHTDSFMVGSHGQGTLAILNGGALSDVAAELGTYAGGQGTASVDGAGSTWTNSAGFYVGDNGTGVLNVSNGGAVKGTVGQLGVNAGSSGTATISGAGSAWLSSNNLTVGDKGAGAVTIQSGGKVGDQQAFLGNDASGHGDMTVTGAGSTWSSTGGIAVGGAGEGVLKILDGGAAINATAYVGFLSTGSGNVTVDGVGSNWVSSFVSVGYEGSGELTVSNGATASTLTGLGIANSAGSKGIVNIGGASGSPALAAGTISGKIAFGNGTGVLNFNHTDPHYVLASNVSGSGTINHLAGVTTLTGVSGGFGGSTIVSGGKLLVDGTLGGSMAVFPGGTLGGAGTLTGLTTVGSGGTLLGVQGQTLTLSSLVLASGSRIDATLGAPGGAGLFNVMGNLVLDGEVGVTNIGGFGAGVYRLIDYTGTLTDNVLDVGALPNGITSVVQTSISHQVNLVMSGAVIQGPAPDIQFWNGVTTTANGTVNGGPGVWTDGVLTNWTDANGARNDAWGGKFAVFQNNPGSVTIDAVAAVSITGLQFIGQGWTVTGDPITLAGDNGATVIRVGDGSAASASDVATIGSVLNGSSRLVKDDLGTLVLSGANTYSGGTTIKGGTLQIGDGGASGSVQGDVVNDGVLAFNRSDATTVASAISGAGAVQVQTGAVTLTSDNSYTGLTTIRGGATLRLGNGGATGAISGDVANTGLLEFDRSNDFSFAGKISGNGALAQIGSGRTILTGDSSGFAGSATVTDGTLIVNGKLGGTLAVQTAGRLQGVGTVGDLSVAGTVAPGNSIGTLNVNGSITFAAGSIYEVEANAAGQSDKILASGAATIGGGTVKVLAGAGVYDPSTTYTILTAAGGRSGAFTNVTSNLAFLDPSLSYDAQSVYLKLTRNDIDFAAAGATPNQIATGGAVEHLGWGNLAYNAVLNLSKPQASEAFDQLSGEIHASLKGSLIEESRFVREATLKRLLPAQDGREPAGVWGQGFGAWGRMDGDGNAATLKHSVSGFLMGADAPVLTNWRAGLVGGFSRASAHLPARHSSAESQTYHLGAYGGGQWGGLSLRSGLAYSWHNITVGRSVELPGFTSVFSSRYDAHTAQAFAEVGYGFHAGKATLEPFANVAHVRLHTDGFSERGVEAALQATGDTSAVTFTNLGWRVAAPVTLGKVTARFKGTLGWRHAFDDVDPSRFTLPGGDTFEISGVPLAKNAVIVAPSVDFDLWPDATLGVSYGGQFGSASSEQTLRANFLVRF